MKKLPVCLLTALIFIPMMKAQELVVPDGYEVVDSVVFRPADAIDMTLAGKSIFNEMPDDNVSIHQSDRLRSAMNEHIKANASKKIAGYRVRIFFDNKQDSRGASEAALKRFESLFPGMAAYRSFVSPFFKVTVGDFRTKSEAVQFHQEVVKDFPTAFVVKENINYPIVDKEHSYVVDTLLIIKPSEQQAQSL